MLLGLKNHLKRHCSYWLGGNNVETAFSVTKNIHMVFRRHRFFSSSVTFFALWIREMRRVKRSAKRQELLVSDYCSGCILHHNKILIYSQATLNIALHVTIGQGLFCRYTSAATSGLHSVCGGGKGSCICRVILMYQPWNRCWDDTSSQNFIRCVKTWLHKGTWDHNPLAWDRQIFQACITFGGTHAPQSRLQPTNSYPFGLHTITQTHHDEHNNYWTGYTWHPAPTGFTPPSTEHVHTESNRGRNNCMG